MDSPYVFEILKYFQFDQRGMAGILPPIILSSRGSSLDSLMYVSVKAFPV